MQFCGQTFSCNSNLRSHVDTVHKKLKKHKCTYCKKEFGQLPHLKKHVIIAHEKQDIVCDLCGKSFPHPDYLKRHIKGFHEKFKAYECEYCGKDFDRTLYLKNHIDRDHKGIKFSGGKVNVLLL